MERTTAGTNLAVRLLVMVTMAALTWMALMAFSATSAQAFAPGPPAGPDAEIGVSQPQFPHPGPDGGGNGSLCSPDGDCTPPDRCEERPDAPECQKDPCEERPEAEECKPGGGEIPTPTRIETGAGGTAGADSSGIGTVVIGAGALGLLTALTRRLVVARDQR